MTILEKIKLMVGAENKDGLISILIEQAQSEFLQLANLKELPDNIENIIVDMVIIKYNLQGVEGLASSSYSGATESYSQYPPQLLNAIKRYKRVKVL